MRKYMGLIIYVAIMLLVSILKRAAEQRAKRAQVPVTRDEGDIYTVTLEDMLAEESPVTDHHVKEFSLQNHEQSMNNDLEDLDDLEDSDWGRAAQTEKGGYIEESSELPLHPSWAQAIIFSEIIREPRSKRPWPIR